MKLEILERQPQNRRHSHPLLFVHGAFCGAWIWDEHFLPYFARRGYSAYAVSLRGHGKSEGRGQLAWASLEDYLDDIRSAVEQIPGDPILIGHSLGGVVVQRFMQKHSLPGAVLMASGPPHGMVPCTIGMFLRNPWLFQRLCGVQLGGSKVATPETLRQLIFSKDIPEHDVQRYFSRMRGESLRVGLELNWPMLPRPDSVPTPPLLVLGAENDYFISPVMVWATAKVYRTRAEIFPGMAHAMMLEPRWEQVAERISTWLNALTPAERPRLVS